MTGADGWDAVVVAGGRARRMGGADKLALDVAGRSMLERVLDATTAAERVVVVGPTRPLDAAVTWCRERPEGSGPAAALRAALEHLVSDRVVVLAGDAPLVDADTVRRLLDALVGDGAVAVDDGGRPQWLCSAWRTAALRRAPLEPDGSLHRALSGLQWQPVEVDPRATLDCDTPDDLRRAREQAG